MENREINNVILITVDCLRNDILKNPHIKFKFFDYLKREELYFPYTFSCGPDTLTSFTGLMTSKYPVRKPYYFEGIKKYNKVLPEILKSKGFKTYSLVDRNPVLSKQYGFDRGFTSPYLRYSEDENNSVHSNLKKQLRKINLLSQLFKKIKRKSTSDEKLFLQMRKVNENLIYNKFLEALKTFERKNFVWIHIMNPHHPYLATPEEYYDITGEKITYKEIIELGYKVLDKKIRVEDIATLRNLYLVAVKKTETIIEKIYFKIKEEEMNKNTILFIIGDHGEEFMEHGGTIHGEKLYDELLHVPFFVCNWNNLDVDRLVSNLDVYPSILDLLKIKYNQDEIDGISLMPPNRKREGVFSTIFYEGEDKINTKKPLKQKLSYRTKDRKYIYLNGKYELYTLDSDPSEKINKFRDGDVLEIHKIFKIFLDY